MFKYWDGGAWQTLTTGSGMVAHDMTGSYHTASGLTAGNVIRATGATTFAWQQLDYSDLSGTPSSMTPTAHAIDVASGYHTGTLPLGDLAVGSQGSIIRRGASDWEEYALGSTNNVLKAGATDVTWGTVDWSELSGSQPSPIAHALDPSSGYHSGTLPEADVAFDTSTGHAHTGSDSTKVDYTDLTSIPSSFTPSAHAISTSSGYHTGSLALTDLASYARGSIIIGGSTDWTALGVGSNTYILTSDGTDVSWQAPSGGDAPDSNSTGMTASTCHVNSENEVYTSGTVSYAPIWYLWHGANLGTSASNIGRWAWNVQIPHGATKVTSVYWISRGLYGASVKVHFQDGNWIRYYGSANYTPSWNYFNSTATYPDGVDASAGSRLLSSSDYTLPSGAIWLDVFLECAGTGGNNSYLEGIVIVFDS